MLVKASRRRRAFIRAIKQLRLIRRLKDMT